MLLRQVLAPCALAILPLVSPAAVELLGSHAIGPERLRALCAAALRNAALVKELPPDTLAIMRAFEEDSDTCRCLFEHACQNYSLKDVASNRKLEHFWTSFVDRSFYKFARGKTEQTTGDFSYENGKQAREIINKIVTPSHPLLSHATYFGFDLGHELEQSVEAFESLSSFIEEMTNMAFSTRLSQILANPDKAHAQFHFLFLLYNYSLSMSWKRPTYKYTFAFLMNAGLEGFKIASVRVGNDYRYDYFFIDPDRFAARFYDQLAKTAPQEAQYALERILPLVYEECQGQDYHQIVGRYAQSGLEPVEWVELKMSISEAIQSFTLSIRLSPAHIYLLEALQKDQASQSHRAFFLYTFNNYLPYGIYLLTQNVQRSDYFPFARLYSIYASTQRRVCFWKSLLFSSFSSFAEAYPDHAVEILKHAEKSDDSFSGIEIKNTENSDDSLPGIEIRNAEKSDDSLFGIKVKNGENSDGSLASLKISLLNNYCATLAKALFSGNGAQDTNALLNSISYGHLETFRYLYEERGVRVGTAHGLEDLHHTNHPNDNTRQSEAQTCTEWRVLAQAALCGKMNIVRYLVEHRRVDPSAHSGAALVWAAEGGHIEVIYYLLKAGVQSNVWNSQALLRAAKCGHVSALELLIEGWKVDFGPLPFFEMLVYAAENEHMEVIECVVNQGADIEAAIQTALSSQDTKLAGYSLKFYQLRKSGLLHHFYYRLFLWASQFG